MVDGIINRVTYFSMRCLGQVQGAGNPGGIWRGLGAASDGGTGGRVIQRTFPWIERRNTGVYTIAHHLQCGGGSGGTPLGVLGGGTGEGGIEAMTTATCCSRRGGDSEKGEMADGGQRRGMQGWRWRRCFLMRTKYYWLPPTRGGPSLCLIYWRGSLDG